MQSALKPKRLEYCLLILGQIYQALFKNNPFQSMFGNVTKQFTKFGLIRYIYQMLKHVQATCEHSVQTVLGGKRRHEPFCRKINSYP